jgi:hypothetical protein
MNYEFDCIKSTNLCTWRPKTVYNNRRVRRHHTPSSSAKIRSPFNTLYFYCFMHYAFFLERLYFSFQFCFVCYNKWLDPNKFLLEKLPCFSFAKNTPFFTLIVQRVFSFFATAFSFHFFALIFV